MSERPAFLFDLDGTLVDSVYQHVLAWREALEDTGIELSVWRIHRRIGMSGGLLVNALLRETGRALRQGKARNRGRAAISRNYDNTSCVARRSSLYVASARRRQCYGRKPRPDRNIGSSVPHVP